MRIPKPLIDVYWFERFISKIWIGSKRECWLWQASLDAYDYGQMSVNGFQAKAHRLAHEAWIGPIPAGLKIDHLCRLTRCINFRHLEAVTHGENVRRAREAARAGLRKLRPGCAHGLVRYRDARKIVTPEEMRRCSSCRLLVEASSWN